MNKNGPVIIIEDDPDDQYLIDRVFKRLKYANEVIYFLDGQAALEYLYQLKEAPFLILSESTCRNWMGLPYDIKYILTLG